MESRKTKTTVPLTPTLAALLENDTSCNLFIGMTGTHHAYES